MSRSSHEGDRTRKAPHQYSVAILGTCKMVYSEAGLLPFTLNSFSFDHLQGLTGFVERLMFIQQAAVKSIIIHPGMAVAYGQFAPLRRMTGWKALMVFYEKSSGETSADTWQRFLSLTSFLGSTLERATVCICDKAPVDDHSINSSPTTNPATYTELSKSMEAVLLNTDK